MALNPRKSGILRLNRKTAVNPANGHIGGIPLVEDYKYLSTYLTRTLSAAPHYSKAGSKATYISRSLWMCRSELYLHFSSNLFRLLMHAIRMIASVSSSATSARTVNRREIRGRQFHTFVSSLGRVSAKWWTCSWSKLENSSKWWLPAPITNRYFGVTASPPPGQKPPPCAQSVPRLPSLSPES